MSTSVDIIVPVLGRPHQAADFLLTLDEPRARLYVVAEADDPDTASAWMSLGANVIVSAKAHTFAEKVNEATRYNSSPWVLLVGDDARFTPGWLDACLTVAESGAKVVGTNDRANRRVMAGSHTCHPFISRDYINDPGATWTDGPGVVCHEGYRHNYVDDEIVTAAKQRGVWGFAFDAVIEHLHPVWGTAPDDATYRHGQQFINQDRELYRSRLEASCK